MRPPSDEERAKLARECVQLMQSHEHQAEVRRRWLLVVAAAEAAEAAVVEVAQPLVVGAEEPVSLRSARQRQ